MKGRALGLLKRNYEPAGINITNGVPNGISKGESVMRYFNTAIPEIRKSNPFRILGIGGPGLNGCEELEKYVTPEYLDYKLDDGSGFEEDNNIIGLFHMYHPSNFTHWISELKNFPGWQEEVRKELSYPIAWSKKWRKPIVLSEWGAWAPPCRSAEDFRTYLRFVVGECKLNNVSWIYYSAGINNQWPFNILNTNYGWNQNALDILTGRTPASVPPLSSIINAEFGWSTENWGSAGSVNISIEWNANLSGSTALKLTAKQSGKAEVFQESTIGIASPPSMFLLSLSNRKRYTISFIAKALDVSGLIRLRLSDASGTNEVIWTSEPIEISREVMKYQLNYQHSGMDINNVRLSFLLNEIDQELLIDRIEFRGSTHSPLKK